MENELLALYTKANAPGSYAGVDSLYKAAKAAGLAVNKNDVRRFLSTLDSYTLLKQKRIRFRRNRVYAFVPNELHMADLVDMSKLKKSNNNVSYLLLIIDPFSK